MKSMENNYYETANLPKAPYQPLTNYQVDNEKQDDLASTLPVWPPKPNSFRDVSPLSTHPRTGHTADDFINELLQLNQKRRGYKDKSPPRQNQ